MDCSKNIKHENPSSGAFGTLPFEMVMEIMCHLNIKGLQAMILSSSHFYNIFKKVEKIILYHVLANELGPDIFPVATLHYACSEASLITDAAKAVGRSLIPRPALKLDYNDQELGYVDVRRYRIPKYACTPAAARKILSVYKQIERTIEDYEKFTHRVFTSWGRKDYRYPGFTGPESLQMRLALYAAGSAKLLCPEEYQFDEDEDEEWTTVYFHWGNPDWIILGKDPENDPPFQIVSVPGVDELLSGFRPLPLPLGDNQ
ncbi:uncharacterized protein F4807DRAFT_442878 [Annulohypoxylon truncatum]|uniref:uncharacterized protein n=1 Tax=Annulohypoxylon truncatum TaxID=327061 RepID=UPI0020073760|nr:uncharacterized protein F4807DRAFT_442878 [Annulohypoxylon truncatum]KAI1205512.1 hypothetical protein F4807DRAFT_442878 [Annulohypoxylon truncatum]